MTKVQFRPLAAVCLLAGWALGFPGSAAGLYVSVTGDHCAGSNAPTKLPMATI
jgi:hypothetical protein